MCGRPGWCGGHTGGVGTPEGSEAAGSEPGQGHGRETPGAEVFVGQKEPPVLFGALGRRHCPVRFRALGRGRSPSGEV